MMREWRHVRLLKRMGRGHSESGVRGTQEGELAVLCPACPIPEINLPPNWKTMPPSDQYVIPLSYHNLLFFDIKYQVALFIVHWD